MPNLKAYTSKPESSHVAASITVPKELAITVDKLLTPTGLAEVPKGAWSQLIKNLLERYLEETAGIDSLSLKKKLCGKEPLELLTMPVEDFLKLVK